MLVSHSRRLAEGARELAEQVAQGKVAVFAVGGLDDGTVGTNPEAIQSALEVADNPAGTLVLMDLGSAILGAEMALEALPEDKRARVRLSEAPFVEGAVAAAAQLAAGAPLAEAAAEAAGALAPKAGQLGVVIPQAPATVAVAGREATVTVRNPMGLHARPAARFVREAARFACDISVRNLTRGAGPVSAKSANAVALLDARRGDQIAIAAHGAEAEQALSALVELVASGFGEVDLPPPRQAAPARLEATSGSLAGIPASPGYAIGPAHLVTRVTRPVEVRRVDDLEAEGRRFTNALAAARAEVAKLRRATEDRLGVYEAAIFDVHALFLDDPEMVIPVKQAIAEERLNAEAAWQRQVELLAARYQATDNPVLRARAADVRDVGARVLSHLTEGRAPAVVAPRHPVVLVAADLAPSEVASLDPALVLAICTASGGPTAHAAILARRLGVPAVVGLGPALLETGEGVLLAVDGTRGTVVVDPSPETRTWIAARREGWLVRHAEAAAGRFQPARTRDGRRVEVAANAGSLADVREAVAQGAEGIGLLRTEFLFLDRQSEPGEEEQVAAYRAIFEALGGLAAVIRTFDIGGDKPVPYLDLPKEANPFLGQRGLRLGLAVPALLKSQLRAILRAGSGRAIRIMFPMVTTAREVEQARALLEQANVELAAEGCAAAVVQTGAMVEVPSLALLAPKVTPLVDFFSIGTNDLAQYTLAADRGNPATAGLADALHPAVLALIQKVVEAGHQAAKWVGVCGEVGGEPLAIPLLLGLGVDELSMNAAAIPGAKAVIRRLDYRETLRLAEEALAAEGPAEVRALVRRSLPWLDAD